MYSVLQSNVGSEHASLASLRFIPPNHSAVTLSRSHPLCLRTRFGLPVKQPKKSFKKIVYGSGGGGGGIIYKSLYGEAIQEILQFLKVNCSVPLVSATKQFKKIISLL